jgi:hypothetical protein
MGHSKISCAELISQLRNYKLNEHPYNIPYFPGNDTPLKWWNTCFSTQLQLQNLAIMLFSITPHAANCERIWSSIGWFYGKRRTRLSIQTIESLTKIHQFYMSNIKNQLRYLQPTIDNDEIKRIIEESLSESYEESFEEEEDLILSSLHEPESVSYINQEDENLNIVSMFNLEPIVVIEYTDISELQKYNNSDIESDNSDNDFNVNDLVSDILK